MTVGEPHSLVVVEVVDSSLRITKTGSELPAILEYLKNTYSVPSSVTQRGLSFSSKHHCAQ